MSTLAEPNDEEAASATRSAIDDSPQSVDEEVSDEQQDEPSVDGGREGPRPATIISITAVAFAVGAVAIGATYAVPLALLTAVGVAAAVIRRNRKVLGLSTAGGVGAVLLHGALGGGPLGTVIAAGLFVFAWDQTDNALDLDAQLGQDAITIRGELAHAAYSLLLMLIAGGGAYAIALFARGSRPLPALVLLLLGAILLTAAIRKT